MWTRNVSGAWQVWLDAQSVTGATDDDLGDVALDRGPAHPPIPTRACPGRGCWARWHPTSASRWGAAAAAWGGVGGGVGGPILSGKTQIDREVAHFTNTLLSTERTWMFERFNRDVNTALDALRRRGYPRDARRPPDGARRAGSGRTIGETKGTYDMTQAAHRLSSSYQLAASYGTLRVKVKGAARPDTLAFVHVWRIQEDGSYRLIVDLETRSGIVRPELTRSIECLTRFAVRR